MNFALILFVLLVVTGALYAVDILKFRKMRAKNAKEPLWVEWGASFFPVILIVFVLRSFLFEPFKIPSGSMIPTLLVGDCILVNKFTYGIRLPVINKKVIDINSPQRGDVMVFRYPEDPSLDYIKRVVGLPGDHIEYKNKRLIINGQPLETTIEADYSYTAPGLNQITAKQLSETLGEHTHAILNDDDAPVMDGGITVPAGHYFVMGDNRDHSNDSRFWGFVPEENVVGKAFMIWWNFDNFGRIGESIR